MPEPARKRQRTRYERQPRAPKRSASSAASSSLSSQFVYDEKEWTVKAWPFWNIAILRSTNTANVFAVKKLVPVKQVKKTLDKPCEVAYLDKISTCNRLAKHLHCFKGTKPDEENGELSFEIIHEYYPMGDMRDWRDKNFLSKNNKPVPESYIWRMFVQMAQAVAFLQNAIGPDKNVRRVRTIRLVAYYADIN